MSNIQPLNLLSIENKNIEECIYNIRSAIYDPEVDNNFEDTFKRADSKMYQNKKEIKSKGKK